MALDFLILYEHTVREYESDLLLKLELERRGYTVRIRQLLDAKDLRLFGKDKPEVLVASCMYDNEAINSHVYNNIGKCNKIVNLHWEQMLSDTQEEGDWFNMNGNAKRCVQTCWGQRTAQRLQAHGMDAKNTPVTGAVMMDFLRPEFKGYFKDKETLCKEFGLDPAKQLHLYISSFGYASMTDQEVAELSKMAGTDFSGFARTNRVSMEKTLAWFDRYLGDHPEVELVYRRHPSEWKCKALDELAANIAASKWDDKMDAEKLKASVARWNELCDKGADEDFGRQQLAKVETGPFYAIPLYPGICNTIGGARRNENANIVDPSGNPIPRLYSAGSFGNMNGHTYAITGGNGSENWCVGRIAGRNAAALEPWDAATEA